MKAKDVVTQWVMNHMDGESYKIGFIGHETKTAPGTVRQIIRQLVKDKKISASKQGGSRHTKWMFGMPNGDLPQRDGMSPYPDPGSTEAKVLAAICQYQLDNDGRTPTIREILEIADIRSTSTVNYHLIKLVNRGLLTQDGFGNSRMAQVTGGMFQIPNQILERRTIESYDYFVTEGVIEAKIVELQFNKPAIYANDFQGSVEQLALATPDNSAFVGKDPNLKMIANALGMGVFDPDVIE